VPAKHREERLLLFAKVAQDLPVDFASQIAEVVEDARSARALALHSPDTGSQLDQHRFGVTMLPQELLHDRFHVEVNLHLSRSNHCQAAVDAQRLARDVGGVG
jgi:hypothetical protein